MITLDRSTLENYAECPQRAYLKILFDALRAEATGKTVFDWEKERIAQADPMLISTLRKAALCGTTNALCDTGILIHEMIEKAFQECDGDTSIIPDWISDNFPKIRPDVQPEAIRAGRFVCDQIADLHVKVLAVEKQISVAVDEALILTTRLDLLAQGLSNSLHVWDWKTGYKRRTASETHDSFQGQFTAALLWDQPCYANVDVIHYWYMETRFGTRPYARFERNAEHPRLPHLTQKVAFDARISQALTLFASNNQECWPHDEKCCQCDMVRFCAMAHIDAAEISDDPKAFIDKLAYDMASVARRKKAATAWVKAKGAIVGTKVIYDRKRPTDRFTCTLSDIGDGPKSRADVFAGTGDEELDGFFK